MANSSASAPFTCSGGQQTDSLGDGGEVELRHRNPCLPGHDRVKQLVDDQPRILTDLHNQVRCFRGEALLRKQNLTVSQYKKQYTDGTVPSFYRFRSITLNPLYDDTFS